MKMEMCNRGILCLFYLTSLLIFLSCEMTLSSDSPEISLKRTLLQSSNSETFCLKTLSQQDHQDLDTNETCTTTTFQLRNTTQLLSEYPLVSHSFPIKNSSRFFCSNRSSASLTILVKSFKLGVMFLNFSYFIGKTDIGGGESPTPHPLPNNDSKPDTKLLNIVGKPVNVKEKATSITLFSLQPGSPVVMTNNQPTVTQTLLSELNQPSLSISISSPPSKIATESILIKQKNSRKRRSVIQENISHTALPSMVQTTVLTGKSKSEIKPKELTPTQEFHKRDFNESSLVSEPSLDSSNIDASVANIDSLTLVQAVQMIKSAAAAISKGNVPKSVAATGHTDTLSNSGSSSGNNVQDSNPPETATEKIIPVHAIAIPTSKPNPSNQTDIKGTTEIMPQLNHESKITTSRNEKSSENKRRNKGKLEDNAERAGKDGNSDNGDNDQNGKGSSSSSSSEEELNEQKQQRKTEIKPKISYKMWKASFEKENRPPGLYVTVNDDIVFDNWDGIWEKHFVLGRWSGAKTLLDSKRWNYTNIFMNLDGVTTGRDLRITFEWEPINEQTELILSDIEISTLVSPSASCSFPIKSNDDSERSPATKGRAGLGQLETPSRPNENGNSESVIVLKQNTNRKEGWETFKLFKTVPWDGIDNVNLHQHPLQPTLHSDKVNSGRVNILSEVLDQVHDDDDDMHASKASFIKNTSSSVLSGVVNASVVITDLKSKFIAHDTNSSTISKTLIPSNKLADSIVPPTSKTTTSTLPTVSPLPLFISTTTPIVNPPSSTTNSRVTKKSSNSFSTPVTAATIARLNENISVKSPPKVARKTDSVTALMVTGFTGVIALTILVAVLKKRFDISINGRNSVR